MGLKYWRRQLTDPCVGACLHLSLGLVGFLSYRGMQRLAVGVGPVLAALYPAGRRLVRANLRVAFPEWSDARLSKVCTASFRHLVMTFLEFLWFARHPERAADMVSVDDIAAAVMTKTGCARGAMMLTPHLGNWELMGQVVAVHGIKVCSVAHPIRNRWVRRVVDRARRLHGQEIIASQGAVRGMLKALRAGKAIGMLLDQNTRLREGGVFVDYFGLPVTTTRAPASLVRRLGVPVTAFACVRDACGLHVCVETLPKPVSAYTSDEELAQAMMTANEALVRQYPEQYLWLYRRWRYIPTMDRPHADIERFPYYAKRTGSGT